MSDRLKEHIINASKELTLKLELFRSTGKHNGIKGAKAEAVFRDILKPYLPSSSAIGHGEVIDSNDKISRQLDVIVTNAHHPRFYKEGESGLYLKDGTSLAGEIKMSLATKDFEAIYKSCNSYKKLKVNIENGSRTFGNIYDVKRYVSNRGYFVFAYESKAKLQTVADYFEQMYSNESVPYEMQVDVLPDT